jgi:DNA-binding NtrC family response regulator
MRLMFSAEGNCGKQRKNKRMARVMICDNDKEMTGKLMVALRAAKYEAVSCLQANDLLREANAGQLDLVAVGLDNPSCCVECAMEMIAQLAPDVAVIGLHERPSDLMRTAARTRLTAILPRPVSLVTFMYAVARALEAQQPRNSRWATT